MMTMKALGGGPQGFGEIADKQKDDHYKSIIDMLQGVKATIDAEAGVGT